MAKITLSQLYIVLEWCGKDYNTKVLKNGQLQVKTDKTIYTFENNVLVGKEQRK